MTEAYSLQKTPKQAEAIRLIASGTHTLLEGGSRSGKTLIALYAILVRAIKYSGTDHLICRFRFAHAKQSICFQTMPKLLKMLGLSNRVILNKSEWIYQLPNGSTIWIGGLDDKERAEKILGLEFATIYLNEASQISYNSYETVKTRLNPPKGVPGKLLSDYNPPSKNHWGWKIFHTRKFPDGRDVPENDYRWIKMNPADNKNNSPDYLKGLESLSLAKRKRFLDGDYGEDSGNLWRRAWIKYNAELPAFVRIVVGVDPTGSVAGDEAGIVVSGLTVDSRYVVLDDYSMHGTPSEWAGEAVAAFRKWKADCIVAERNYGGDMVESTIRNAGGDDVKVKLVTSSRGKVVRAEPVSAIYEQGKVVHRVPMLELEDELCSYDPAVSASPNRMDALVFSINELAGEGLSILDVL